MGAKAHRRKEIKMRQKVKTWTKRTSGMVLAVLLILTLVASFAVPVLASVLVMQPPPSFVLKWGTNGAGDGQFSGPHGVAVDTAGNVYVADTGNGRIEKFTGTGTFITKWNSGGTLLNPWGIDVSRDGYVYVSDMSNNRIQKFTTTGTWLANWTPAGSDNLSSPYGLCVDAWGNVYVADSGNSFIHKYDGNGNQLAKWGGLGTADGQLQYPYDVAADASGNIYVADLGNNRIDKFTSTGTFITKWGTGPGTSPGQFNAPKGVAVDTAGSVYAADAGNNRIQKFTNTGTFLSMWGRNGGDGSSGCGDGEFSNPYTLVVTPWQYVYVADTDNNRIQLFAYPQTSSASVNTTTGTGTATFVTSGGSISGLTALAQSQLACTPKSGFNFPQGFFSFNIINLIPGTTVTITITLPGNMPINTQYWKCINGNWVDCTSLLGDNDGDNILTLTITDGGLGDADGVANGTIVDPGGPAVAAAQAAPASPHASPLVPTQIKLDQVSVQYLSVNPKQAAASQPVTISTNVVNTGDNAVNYGVDLKINGQVEQTRMVSVGPQTTQPVKFTVTKAQPGTYTIDVGGQNGAFTILGTGNSTTSKSASSAMIVILAFGVLILITVVAVLLTRRQA
jgi:streptogramin lyase